MCSEPARGLLAERTGSQTEAIRLVLRTPHVSAALAEQMRRIKFDAAQGRAAARTVARAEFPNLLQNRRAPRCPPLPTELSLSVKTVSTYRTRVLEKMQFSSNADLTAYALRNGLIK